MSTYFAIYTCADCGHSLPLGFVGELNSTAVFCTACQERFHLAPAAGEQLFQSAVPHQLYDLGKKEVVVFSKKGRVKKNKMLRTWVDTGLRVPIREDVVQIGDALRLTYQPCFEALACPHCQALGQLLTAHDYLQICRQCGSSHLIESEL